MKKQILIGSLVLVTAGANAQTSRVKPVKAVNMTAIMAQKYAMAEEQNAAAPKLNTPVQTSDNAKETSAPPTQISWKELAGSMNVYGMLVSASKPLQYNDNVNAISFIHRKSTTYNANPSGDSNTGTIVAEISTNWGTTFDSTAVWANATHGGRYPQGGIYSAPGNSLISQAYVIATGPIVTSGSSFTGNFYASKKLDVLDNTPDQTPNAQQYVPFTGTTSTSFPLHGWSRQGFSSTDDGVVRSLALIQGDNTTLGAAADMRGIAVVKGTFNAGTFNWTADTLIPNVVVTSSNEKQISSGPQMAWNESGTVGYAVVPGALSTATGANRGFQPIVFKTTNSGASWSQVTGIDFNSPSMSWVTDHIATVSGSSTLSIPYFMDYDLAVDTFNRLHIGATIISTYSSHDDSLGYIGQFTMSVNPGDEYYWGHTPGNRPYVYDFIGDGSAAWSLKLIDSLSSEDPGASTSSAGYNINPWDPTGTGSAKVNIDSRLQMGRTPNGKFIYFSWAESDTNFTTSQTKYNHIPNLTSRCLEVTSGGNNIVSSNEINVTKNATNNSGVNSRATLHYMSSRSTAATITAAPGGHAADMMVPFTVTNSNPYSQLTNNITWFAGAKLSFTINTAGVSENSAEAVLNSSIYPNPANELAVVSLNLKETSAISIELYNALGQLVKTVNANGNVGENTIEMNIQTLTPGVYFTKIKVAGASHTKKLIIE